MKIHLACGDNILSDYINIDSIIPQKIDVGEFIPGLYYNLDMIIENNSCDEILFGSPLNIVPPESFANIISHWRDKLKINGKIKASFFDIQIVFNILLNNKLDHKHYNFMLFGERKSFLCVMDTNLVKNVMPTMGLKIEYIENNKKMPWIKNLIIAKK